MPKIYADFFVTVSPIKYRFLRFFLVNKIGVKLRVTPNFKNTPQNLLEKISEKTTISEKSREILSKNNFNLYSIKIILIVIFYLVKIFRLTPFYGRASCADVFRHVWTFGFSGHNYYSGLHIVCGMNFGCLKEKYL